jgi:hypothetical protein
MNVSPDILRRDTVALIREIDKQIEEVALQADGLGTTPQRLRDQNGSWPIIPLLQAKAQAYNTLVQLQTKK